MMKKTIVMLAFMALITIAICSVQIVVNADTNTNTSRTSTPIIYVNDGHGFVELDSEYFEESLIIDGITYSPTKTITKGLGSGWSGVVNNGTKLNLCIGNGSTYEIEAGNNEITIPESNSKIMLNHAPRMIGGKLYIPLREIAEKIYEARVEYKYNAGNHEIKITLKQ